VEKYDGEVKATLVTIWKIFDYPCGARLKTLLTDETRKLRLLGEISCSDLVEEKLLQIGIATIDRKLEHEKEVLLLNQKYSKKNPLLSHMVPIKTSADFDRNIIGHTEIDFVESCGVSVTGEYVNNLSVVDVATGWWEGEAVMGKSQERAINAVKAVRERLPFKLLGLHPDNGTNLLNYLIYNYTQVEKIEFTRSRAYKKNDNCFVEQKNSTHVRKMIGYLRYDTKEEMEIINDLYHHELRLYKNFFQPVMKLKDKVRFKGKIHRKYDVAKTPYARMMESDQICEDVKVKLRTIYESLNPAQLKRNIDRKLQNLYKTYQKKTGAKGVESKKKLKATMVSFNRGVLR
jgi:DNA-binding FrmR family transcriptional regulator